MIKKATAFVLALFLMLSVLPAGMAGEVDVVAGGVGIVAGGVSAAANIVPAKGMEDFTGEWFICRVVYEDGKVIGREEMITEDNLPDSGVDITITEDRILLFDMDENAGDPIIKPEYVPEDGTLKLVNGREEPPVLRMNDNGMLSCFVQLSEEVQYTVYFARK